MMHDEDRAVSQLPPRMVNTPVRRHRSEAILQAVERFAAETRLTPLQRQLLGLIIDEAIESVSPKAPPIPVGEASNDGMHGTA